MNVRYKDKMYKLSVVVVPRSGVNLLGQNWLVKLPINLSAICNQIKWTDLEQEFSELFKPGLATLKNTTGKLHIKPNNALHFMKAEPVPLTLREKVVAELDRMVSATVIEQVSFSGWASSIL